MDETESLVTDFLHDAGDLAHRAIAQDTEGHFEIAIYFYRESIALLDRSRDGINRLISAELEDSHSSNENEGQDGSGRRADFWRDKMSMSDIKRAEYQRRIQELETRKWH